MYWNTMDALNFNIIPINGEGEGKLPVNANVVEQVDPELEAVLCFNGVVQWKSIGLTAHVEEHIESTIRDVPLLHWEISLYLHGILLRSIQNKTTVGFFGKSIVKALPDSHECKGRLQVLVIDGVHRRSHPRIHVFENSLLSVGNNQSKMASIKNWKEDPFVVWLDLSSQQLSAFEQPLFTSPKWS